MSPYRSDLGPAFELDESREERPTAWEVVGVTLLVCIGIAFLLMLGWLFVVELLDFLNEPVAP